MAKKEVDGEGLNIPNRIKALPVKRPGPIVAAVIVVLLAAMLIQGLITNPRLGLAHRLEVPVRRERA